MASLMAALSACTGAGPVPGAVSGLSVAPVAPVAPLRVTNGALPFAPHEGAAAKRMALATCAAAGLTLRPSIYDRFEGGAWVFPEGCT